MDNFRKTIRMKRADHEKWDAALRSGEYKKGTGALMHNGKYCCLGVLQHCLNGDVERFSDGASEAMPSLYWLQEKGIKFINAYDRASESPILDSFKGVFKDSIRESRLPGATTINDHTDATFVEIADLIKNHVEFTDG